MAAQWKGVIAGGFALAGIFGSFIYSIYNKSVFPDGRLERNQIKMYALASVNLLLPFTHRHKLRSDSSHQASTKRGGVAMGSLGDEAPVAKLPVPAPSATLRGNGHGVLTLPPEVGPVAGQCIHLRAFLAQGGANVFTPLARCCLAASYPGNAPRTRTDATLVRVRLMDYATQRVAPPRQIR